ncbi:MAG: DNA repair protein RadA [Lachnospiraceae bacterium]|nr:DNA repair protein RadA [Lachnospiraceae bacterium]
MAVKRNTAYFCQNCGYETSKWLGQCPGCGEWNTFVEEPVVSSKEAKSKDSLGSEMRKRVKLSTISSIKLEQSDRISSGLKELDRVLGGGIVKGSLILVGGDPGIGKSTLMLQVCRSVTSKGKDIIYASGEESLSQIKLRAERLGFFSDSLKLVSETNLNIVESLTIEANPSILVIDSIQTMYSETVSAAPGSVSQVREATGICMRLAKTFGITVFLIGHVTKEGAVAGPRVLEHMVDCVLYFEGDSKGPYRILRGVKNRFGSTDEIGVFEMGEKGLKEVENPSEFMLSGRPENASGSVVACCMEGTRPLLVEIQALVSDTNFGFPKRQATGADFNRLNLLIAVLEKRVGLRMSGSDAYLNIAGGIKVAETALDLGIVTALVSSFRNKVVDKDLMVFGEVGLSGEVRAVSSPQQRVMEAARLGFKKVILPYASLKSVNADGKIRLIGVKSVNDLNF